MCLRCALQVHCSWIWGSTCSGGGWKNTDAVLSEWCECWLDTVQWVTCSQLQEGRLTMTGDWDWWHTHSAAETCYGPGQPKPQLRFSFKAGNYKLFACPGQVKCQLDKFSNWCYSIYRVLRNLLKPSAASGSHVILIECDMFPSSHLALQLQPPSSCNPSCKPSCQEGAGKGQTLHIKSWETLLVSHRVLE